MRRLGRFESALKIAKENFSLLKHSYTPDGKGGWVEHKWDFKWWLTISPIRGVIKTFSSVHYSK